MSYVRSTFNDSVPSSRTFRRLRVTRQKESDSEPIKEEFNCNRRRDLSSTQPTKSDAKTTSRSSLVQSMTANFERSHASSSDSSTKGRRKLVSNYNNNITTGISEQPSSTTSSFASSTNGNDGSEAGLNVKENQEVSNQKENSKKASSASRRARLQREKRMLRQKRRSTGVVSLKDLENDDESEDNSKEDEDLKNETQLNTIQNEFTSNDNSGAIVASFGVNKLSIIEDKKIDQPINQLNTCSKNLDRNNEAVLKEKLVLCEENIKKLKEKITKMEEDLNEFSDENRNLKRKNKLLEDENKTMLRLIKARGFE